MGSKMKNIMQSRLFTDHTKDKLKRKAMKRTGWLITWSLYSQVLIFLG